MSLLITIMNDKGLRSIDSFDVQHAYINKKIDPAFLEVRRGHEH